MVGKCSGVAAVHCSLKPFSISEKYIIDVTIHNLVDKKVGISWQKGFNVRPANRGKSFRGDWTALTLSQKKRGEKG